MRNIIHGDFGYREIRTFLNDKVKNIQIFTSYLYSRKGNYGILNIIKLLNCNEECYDPKLVLGRFDLG